MNADSWYKKLRSLFHDQEMLTSAFLKYLIVALYGIKVLLAIVV